MFTGIIRETGTVAKLVRRGKAAELAVGVPKSFLTDVRAGDSIAINGVCQTVVTLSRREFQVFVSSETIARTTLSSLKPNAIVNLEKAMRADHRFDGHFVQGHVDDVGEITKVKKSDGTMYLEISFDDAYNPFIVEKGSIAVDGVSLTVNAVREQAFSLLLIPETLHRTTLEKAQAGMKVNLEFDILAKYAAKMNASVGGGLTEEKLRDWGYT